MLLGPSFRSAFPIRDVHLESSKGPKNCSSAKEMAFSTELRDGSNPVSIVSPGSDLPTLFRRSTCLGMERRCAGLAPVLMLLHGKV